MVQELISYPPDGRGIAPAPRITGALKAVDRIVVATGREEALPTVVGSLVDVPLIGLPVLIGYGHGGGGEAALGGMLQSCTVPLIVNIDAGFVAGSLAVQIARN